ncbi:zinc-containing alcohol dehydrogenase [Aspergillus bombycis]|uniref:Zinc-containing alcohol dehydrogenase n=1 Tax=Aspergillus bombycis TaxID=109264 RepID=A0A1F8A0R2_9EURO|nr:zinc-containing alcohol dehydrogenase [Aspergillus bombycis]OGM45301.1 zinc-containing alcohol dehydrogenase [Aspergillus bombycis]
MQAIRVHPAPAASTPYSPSNPAPSSALHLDHNVPIPKPSKPGDILVRVKATTVIRDMLTWPETYYHEYAIIGNDISGIVTEVFSQDCKFQPGDEVFGMAAADRGSTWAEYALLNEDELALKPRALAFDQAAALPLSAQTAYEALFDHGGIPVPSVEQAIKNKARSSGQKGQRLLITGAAGAVGIYLVQLASAAGVHVVAATSSNARNEEFLRGLGADEAIEYEVLAKCWDYVKETGVLVSVDSASFNFVEEHEKRGIRKDGVRALFFIIKGSSKALHYIAELVDLGTVESFVVGTYPFSKAREAYDYANGRYSGRGKFVITI